MVAPVLERGVNYASARTSLGSGAALGGLFVAIAAVSIAPGRAALASVDTTHSRLEVLLAGMFRDMTSILPSCGFAALVALATGVLIGRGKPEAHRIRWLTRGFPAALFSLCPLLWLLSSSAEEFRIQRGIDPTWFDLRLAFTDPAFVSSSLSVFLYRRHLVPSLVAVVTLLFVGLAFRELARRFDRPRAGFMILGFALSVTIADGLALLPIDPHARVFGTLTDRSAVGQPFTTFFEPFGSRPANIQLGLSSVLAHARIAADDVRTGAALLGLPPPHFPAPGTCAPHPFARSLSFDGEERALATGMPSARAARAARLLIAFESLSAALFEGPHEAPVVLEVFLEGFRADDVRALNPNAAREITPFMNSLYEGTASEVGQVLAAGRAFQAGVRTAQALSAAICGIGTLPFGAALGRDLGPLPFRCLPDVLEDAGFSAHFYYGARVSFDNMDAFLGLHGFSRIVGQWQLPRNLPAVYWGVTDRSLFDAVLAESRTWSPAPRFAIVMTVTNHMPFARPGDLPNSVQARVEAGLAMTRNVAGHDDVPRLLTLSYTDDAFERFTRSVSTSPFAKRAIIVAMGDHSTKDRFVWPRPDGAAPDTDEAKSRIPLAAILPEALVASSAHPERTREAVRVAREELNRFPISENDVPTLILALLSKSRELVGLPPSSRWHTLGGTVTSPWFSGPGGADTALSGINSSSQLFSLDADGRRTGALQEAGPLNDADDLYASCPPLQPVRSLLASFMKTYATTCRSPASFRAASATRPP